MTWLNRFIPTNVVTRGWLNNAFGVGGGWSAASDGKCLLAVRDGGRSGVVSPPAETAAQILGWLTWEPDRPTWTTLSDLWLWADHYPMERCQECLGGGCYWCDERGWYQPGPEASEEPDYVAVFDGHGLDMVRMCRWLAPELQDRFGDTCWFAARGPRNTEVQFGGDGWRLLMMPTQGVDPADHRTYVPGAGAWWHQRRDPVSRLVAADWCAERGMEAEQLYGRLAALKAAVGEPEAAGVGGEFGEPGGLPARAGEG